MKADFQGRPSGFHSLDCESIAKYTYVESTKPNSMFFALIRAAGISFFVVEFQEAAVGGGIAQAFTRFACPKSLPAE